jgi:hypothetical protein
MKAKTYELRRPRVGFCIAARYLRNNARLGLKTEMKKEVAKAIEGAILALQQVMRSHPDSSDHSRAMYRMSSDAHLALLKLGPLYEEEDCPGHCASMTNPKVCPHCGTHIDSLRPDETVQED